MSTFAQGKDFVLKIIYKLKDNENNHWLQSHLKSENLIYTKHTCIYETSLLISLFNFILLGSTMTYLFPRQTEAVMMP